MDKMIVTWYDQVAASYTSDLNSPMYERAAKNAKTDILLILILVSTKVHVQQQCNTEVCCSIVVASPKKVT